MTRDLLKEALGAMQHNRRRTALTMLGMAWGIATIVILLAFGSGFERAIGIIFSSWGTDVVGIEPARASCRCRVTALALSVARRVHNSTMAAFRGAPR